VFATVLYGVYLQSDMITVLVDDANLFCACDVSVCKRYFSVDDL